MLRRTPMKRSRKPLQRTRLKPKSRKRAKEDRALDDRPQFKAAFGFCFLCGRRTCLEAHHIAGRHTDEQHARANLVMLCGDFGNGCHRSMTDNKWTAKDRDNKTVGVLLCLALKQLYDPEHYDLDLVRRVWGKGPECITEDDVTWAIPLVREIQRSGG